tara:strand:+ start:52 stop:498 length:447 start_codon:yes stop_codon:yes gene_type:complete
MSQYKISKKRLAQIIKEEYQNLHELEDPRSPSPMSYEYEGAADDFRNQIMNLVIQLGPLTLEPKLANAVEIEIRDVLNTLGIGTDPRSPSAGNRKEDDELENPEKADLDDDGKLSGYEKKRGKAIEKAMKKESMDSIRQLIQQELQNL